MIIMTTIGEMMMTIIAATMEQVGLEVTLLYLTSCCVTRNRGTCIKRNRLVGGGDELGPLGTAATDWPIVPVPGDYDDGEFGGMKIGRGTQSTRRIPAPAQLCPPQIPLPGSNLGRHGWKPATNCLIYGASHDVKNKWIYTSAPLYVFMA
jgi:hypothetical protein